MATHNMFQAETLTNRAAVLLEGKIREIGTAQEIFKDPSEYFISFASAENVFSGISKILKEGTSIINIGDGVLIEAVTKKSGKIRLYVRPEDIVLSRHPIISSARNTFKGKIVGVSDLKSLVKLKINVGKEFVVQVTKRSFTEMQLNVGTEVYITLKASSVHVI